MKKPFSFAVLLATGFGLGLSPWASGTVGTLWGVLIVWLSWGHLSLTGQIVMAVVLAVLAVPICDGAEKVYRTKDDGRIVADEYLTFPLCMLGLPASPLFLLVAFVTSRVCDIIKPWPARDLQCIPGGPGIVIDDVLANIYSLLLNWTVYLLFFC